MIISRKMRVIHLDDHKLFHAGLRTCLRKCNQELFIQHYENSDDAFDAIAQSIKSFEPIDLIITDLTHMGQNGYEFAKSVRKVESSYFIRTPILLLTMHTRKYNLFLKEKLQENVFDAYLPKSADCAHIVATIEELTGIRIN
jgi:DNA-binding NarL/FixJ family response regulator